MLTDGEDKDQESKGIATEDSQECARQRMDGG